MSEEPKSTGPGCLLWGTAAAVLLLAFLILVPNFLEAKPSGKLTACMSNLKNIATALEMYSSDNNGLYPADTQLLIRGNYLKTLPTCPAAHKVSYDYQVETELKHFKIRCLGHFHEPAYRKRSAGIDCTDFPGYDSKDGLLEPAVAKAP